MTNKEAIKELELMRKFNYTLAPMEAFDLAIKALEERPKGKWELFEKRPCQNLYMCSNCGHIIESMPDRLAENFKGCYCGANMKN